MRLQWPVSKIERVNNLIVVTKENSTETLVAEVVVVTVPLGVLKRGLAFEPPLPDWKTQAISRLGFGVLDKVALKFERPFWRSAKYWNGS